MTIRTITLNVYEMELIRPLLESSIAELSARIRAAAIPLPITNGILQGSQTLLSRIHDALSVGDPR